MTTIHIPVLLNDVIEQLDIQPHDVILDGTLGFGGHASHLIKNLTTGRYIGIDQDHKARNYCHDLFDDAPNMHILSGNFSEALWTAEKEKHPLPTKLLLDLGYSSFQLDRSERGFSFLKNEPLNMRMNVSKSKTAAQVLNTYTEKQLSDIFFNFGELYKNKILVQNIKETRRKKPFAMTNDLVDIIKKSYFFNNKRPMFMKICSQVFQALRIEVNDELKHLTIFLKTLEKLPIGTRIAIISFHSIEDRLIKVFVRDNTLFKPLTKKPIQASQEELSENSRAKSAKLRVFERV